MRVVVLVLPVTSSVSVHTQEQRERVVGAMYERGPAWTGDTVAFGQPPIRNTSPTSRRWAIA